MFAKRLARCVLLPPASGLLAVMVFAFAPLPAQDVKGGKGKQPEFIPAGYDDYQNMLDQIGITQMRKGRDGKGKDTSDDATANPYKDTMPDLMTFKNGSKVTTANQWPKRRAEIVEDFDREVYGRVPKNVPRVKWEVTSTVEGESGGIATVTKTLVGHVDNSAFPQIKVAIQASFTVPKHAVGRVPIILQFGGGFGGKKGGGPNSWSQQALNNGWGYGTINPNSVQPDNNRLREGIIGLTNKGEPRGPEDWGAFAPGPGPSVASLTISKPIPIRVSIRPRCASPACRATARRRSSPPPSKRASPPASLLLPGPAAPNSIAIFSASCWRTSRAATSTTGWPATT